MRREICPRLLFTELSGEFTLRIAELQSHFTNIYTSHLTNNIHPMSAFVSEVFALILIPNKKRTVFAVYFLSGISISR